MFVCSRKCSGSQTSSNMMGFCRLLSATACLLVPHQLVGTSNQSGLCSKMFFLENFCGTLRFIKAKKLKPGCKNASQPADIPGCRGWRRSCRLSSRLNSVHNSVIKLTCWFLFCFVVILCFDESAGVTASSRWLQAAVALEGIRQNATFAIVFFFMSQNLKQKAKGSDSK